MAMVHAAVRSRCLAVPERILRLPSTRAHLRTVAQPGGGDTVCRRALRCSAEDDCSSDSPQVRSAMRAERNQARAGGAPKGLPEEFSSYFRAREAGVPRAGRLFSRQACGEKAEPARGFPREACPVARVEPAGAEEARVQRPRRGDSPCGRFRGASKLHRALDSSRNRNATRESVKTKVESPVCPGEAGHTGLIVVSLSRMNVSDSPVPDIMA